MLSRESKYLECVRMKLLVGTAQTTPSGGNVPRPEHIVIVVEENHSR